MRITTSIKIYIIAFLALCLVSCSEHKGMDSQLSIISHISDTNPDSALTLLNEYSNIGLKTLDEKGQMEYNLVLLKAKIEAGERIKSDAAAKRVASYYSQKGSANEKVLANYLLGVVHRGLNDNAKALQDFYTAIAQADTTNSDCDYHTLQNVYKQMAEIFNMQVLSEEEVWALNNYVACTRKENAQQKKQNNQEARNLIMGILIGVFIISAIAIALYCRNHNRKKKELRQLRKALASARFEYNAAEKELRKLKSHDYEGLIEEKQQKIEELKRTIGQLSEKQENTTEKDDLEKFISSQIVSVFHSKEVYKKDNPEPTKQEWRKLESEFGKLMPQTYSYLVNGNSLSTLEMRTCILLILDFPDSSIVVITNSSPQTISKAKSRANEKLFNEKSARTLKNNLLGLG